MNKPTKAINKKDLLFLLLFRTVYLIFIASMIFSLRAITSISTGALFTAGLFFLNKENKGFSVQKDLLLFSLSCSGLFLLNLISIASMPGGVKAWTNILLTSGILFLPIAVILSRHFILQNAVFMLRSLFILLFIACTYCLGMAIIRFINTGDSSVFFYHSLVHPLKYHAVYFSIILFIALVYLAENYHIGIFQGYQRFRIVLILFFSVFLILLSSKLVIGFYTAFLITTFHRSWTKKRQRKQPLFLIIVFLISLGLVLLSSPVKKRFQEIASGNLSLIQQESFNPGVYFNGLQFRLLQWKFVPEILQERKKWITGVGSLQSQKILDSEYVRRKMYVGDTNKGDTGLLNYNTHNQLLQSLLEYGISGGIIFLLVIASIVLMACQKREFAYTMIMLLLILYAFLESMLKTQYGIILLTFLPVFLYHFQKKTVLDAH
ncbi:MAG TPA: O-antigen ligase family protein [Chitinophagaceae bacterium]|nr:O-antigen ligase family protein [Chitinophagaceae bacterium]